MQAYVTALIPSRQSIRAFMTRILKACCFFSFSAGDLLPVRTIAVLCACREKSDRISQQTADYPAGMTARKATATTKHADLSELLRVLRLHIATASRSKPFLLPERPSLHWAVSPSLPGHHSS